MTVHSQPNQKFSSCLLLLPNTLEKFILRELAEDLLRGQAVAAVEPGHISYGALARTPRIIRKLISHMMASRLRKRMQKLPEVIILFHPIQWPFAQALLRQNPAAELWYSRWDRYEHAYDASTKQKQVLALWHQEVVEKSQLVFCVSQALVDLEKEAREKTVLVPLTAERFPAHDPSKAIVAACLGHLGWRIDWELLQKVCERMPQLTLLLIGAVHPNECKEDKAFLACQQLSNIVWLGPRTDQEAARLILCADVGILPFKQEPFNDAGLPYRILKYARLGRRTVSTDLQGAKTWSYAVDVAPTVDDFIEQLTTSQNRTEQDAHELRAWALEQTPKQQHQPLWDRLIERELT